MRQAGAPKSVPGPCPQQGDPARKGATMPLQRVELIASGYEWTCPNPKCKEHLNHEIEVKEKVKCRKCKRTFTVEEYHHAIG